ncbi:alkyl hydroperoxide reductase subunit D [Rhodothalassium salexigens DSM 2132]|uniref:Alkyl hydroperoxide reductase AhpD n=1 Tax=Rhodothalassium salexigens DSM 2132 TaxID=1188247 RepID=A0A4R2PL12_RHOSA|nr:carboxymuconolactone decarboxylase family protein [Rhodothalassium salexigens]MBB4211458.1 alkyl hydroperoxide reductase subunit D [Rhodothalassium salexigens DSM 2132]MBK1639395.1 alkyl hydroperoxide reductase [Rhodothalassium salexigens DSM 2132]MBK5920659.1 alkyl hydroperoxide reductase [Rhodothalassium salexigens]TCP35378.1 alkyl hydroperoxide reductase subunit D [Rhodothalassium salexigens DSM 2132]
MSIKDLKQAIPDYAKDLRLNISSVMDEDLLTEQQRYGVFLASALAARNATVIAAARAEAEAHLSAEAIEAAKAAAAIMGMNNIYYRFLHLTSSGDYKSLPAKLRMNVIGKPGIEKVDFELYSLAVSAVNGCGMCVDSHEAVVRKAGLKPEQIQAAVRIAAVTHGVAQTLDGESALSA